MVGTKAISNCFSSHSVAPIFDGHRGGKFTISRGMQSCRTTSFLTQGRALLEYEFLGGKKKWFWTIVCLLTWATYGYMVYHTLPQKYFMFIGKWCSTVNQDLGFHQFSDKPPSLGYAGWLRPTSMDHPRDHQDHLDDLPMRPVLMAWWSSEIHDIPPVENDGLNIPWFWMASNSNNYMVYRWYMVIYL